MTEIGSEYFSASPHSGPARGSKKRPHPWKKPVIRPDLEVSTQGAMAVTP
jgi:hypothetical protein